MGPTQANYAEDRMDMEWTKKCLSQDTVIGGGVDGRAASNAGGMAARRLPYKSQTS